MKPKELKDPATVVFLLELMDKAMSEIEVEEEEEEEEEEDEVEEVKQGTFFSFSLFVTL